jgi:hypothetical protein
VVQVITHIQLIPETEGVDIEGALKYPADVDMTDDPITGSAYREAMNPKQIVEALVQLDPDDLDDVFKLMQEHYNSVVGTE